MTERIPQTTAKLVLFKAYLSTDHVSEATGKTIAITISKNGGAFGNPNVGALNATEISSGWYKVALDTTDTGTAGPLAVRGAVATIDDVGVLLEVVSATTGGYTNLDAAISTRASQTSVDDLPTNAELATALGTADDATLAAIAALNNLSAAQVNAEVDTALSDYDGPTNTELTAALAAADDAVLAAIAALNNITAASVWAAGTRTLTAGTNIVLAKGTGVTGFNDLSAAQVNAEADTALTDYDGPTNTELTAALAAADDAVLTAIAALSVPTANANADALLDRAAGVETGMTPRQALRLIASTTSAKLSGAGTTTEVFRNAVADSKDRVTATVDSSGNRSAITYDLT